MSATIFAHRPNDVDAVDVATMIETAKRILRAYDVRDADEVLDSLRSELANMGLVPDVESLETLRRNHFEALRARVRRVSLAALEPVTGDRAVEVRLDQVFVEPSLSVAGPRPARILTPPRTHRPTCARRRTCSSNRGR